jgi:hypothetical protein
MSENKTPQMKGLQVPDKSRVPGLENPAHEIDHQGATSDLRSPVPHAPLALSHSASRHMSATPWCIYTCLLTL